ncbi:putative membrane protein [Comamonas odontotermitis]|uniref:Membrane protein n=1 Tax=Comamonas odontotermitis TaxID=379895 RepID=A0ABR6RAP0_9BURK|nr:hypothetical protein [Comamonas odontotermitis]MBB6576217.1 putative membrane protein [Comamonas odontotermitis]
MLGKIESGLLYLMRLVMVILVLFTLFNFALWSWEAVRKPKPDTAIEDAHKDRDWAVLKISDEELKKITYSDFGFGDASQTLNDGKLAADTAVVAAFAEVDALVRAAIERNPAQRKKLEDDNNERGLAPAQALPALVEAMQAKERADHDTAAAAAVDATTAAVAAAQAADDDWQPQPTSIGEALLNQTRSIITSYNYDAGRAFVLGAPAALKTLLADPQVQAGISKQTTSIVVSNLLLNYNMVFSAKAGESDVQAATPGWLERLLEPSNLLVFTVLLWSFVFLMMIVVFLRVERHLRAMSQEGKALVQRP